jgi:hypothetical protein
MPITYVLKIAVPVDQSIQQHKEALEKRLSALKPRRLNKFHVQTIAYQANNQTSINQFLHSDYTSTCFSLIEPPAAASGAPTNIQDIKVLTGDIGLASIQRRIAELGILSERKQLQIECVGSAYKIGDFQIKIGTVTHSSSNRGLIAEISYSSATSNQEAYGVISEFLQSLFGWTNPNISEMITSLVRKKPYNANYTPEDTIVQYFEHFNYFRTLTQQR